MNEEIYNLAEILGHLLVARKMQITTAESCTGGACAMAITEVPGSSVWFDRGFITYSNLAKIQMLGVQESTLDRFGAVSEATIKEMLTGAIQNSAADFAVATSGIAGPGGGSPEKPVGTVLFGWLQKPGIIHTSQQIFSGNRHQIRTKAVIYALNMASQLLDNQQGH